MQFIKVTDIPPGKFAAYLRILAAYRPEKDNPRRIRFTVGGNLIEYLGKTSTKAADITTVKILFNSVLSTDGARFITLDLKDFYVC